MSQSVNNGDETDPLCVQMDYLCGWIYDRTYLIKISVTNLELYKRLSCNTMLDLG